MTERPILFSAPMVRALLAGNKTQTRRVVKGAPDDWAPVGPEVYSPTVLDRHGDEQPGPDAYGAGNEDGDCWIRCPYRPDDLLWVREAWARDSEDGAIFYRADVGAGGEADVWQHNIDVGATGYRWRPSIHMPRTASRITLEVTDVRVERLQDISEADAISEGLERTGPAYKPPLYAAPIQGAMWDQSAASAYRTLWESINGTGSWDANPWVWAVSFRHHHKGEG